MDDLAFETRRHLWALLNDHLEHDRTINAIQDGAIKDFLVDLSTGMRSEGKTQEQIRGAIKEAVDEVTSFQGLQNVMRRSPRPRRSEPEAADAADAVDYHTWSQSVADHSRFLSDQFQGKIKP